MLGTLINYLKSTDVNELIWVSISSGNGLAPVWCQAITRAYADLLQTNLSQIAQHHGWRWINPKNSSAASLRHFPPSYMKDGRITDQHQLLFSAERESMSGRNWKTGLKNFYIF